MFKNSPFFQALGNKAKDALTDAAGDTLSEKIKLKHEITPETKNMLLGVLVVVVLLIFTRK